MNIETIVVPTVENGRFDALMGDLHYLGSAKPTGDFLRQAVVCGGDPCLGAGPAHRAPQALASALRSLPDQWENVFGYRPLPAETFTDIEKFCGTCYKACN